MDGDDGTERRGLETRGDGISNVNENVVQSPIVVNLTDDNGDGTGNTAGDNLLAGPYPRY
jgi:hypothetical protein